MSRRCSFTRLLLQCREQSYFNTWDLEKHTRSRLRSHSLYLLKCHLLLRRKILPKGRRIRMGRKVMTQLDAPAIISRAIPGARSERVSTHGPGYPGIQLLADLVERVLSHVPHATNLLQYKEFLVFLGNGAVGRLDGYGSRRFCVRESIVTGNCDFMDC